MIEECYGIKFLTLIVKFLHVLQIFFLHKCTNIHILHFLHTLILEETVTEQPSAIIKLSNCKVSSTGNN